MTDEKWLNEMLDAALEDTPGRLSAPDFSAVRAASAVSEASDSPRVYRHKSGGRFQMREVLLAAAALAIVVPGLIFTGRFTAARRLVREDTAVFVREVIGGTIFDEGLEPAVGGLPEGFPGGSIFDDEFLTIPAGAEI
jgi:hypothetical protein